MLITNHSLHASAPRIQILSHWTPSLLARISFSFHTTCTTCNEWKALQQYPTINSQWYFQMMPIWHNMSMYISSIWKSEKWLLYKNAPCLNLEKERRGKDSKGKERWGEVRWGEDRKGKERKGMARLTILTRVQIAHFLNLIWVHVYIQTGLAVSAAKIKDRRNNAQLTCEQLNLSGD